MADLVSLTCSLYRHGPTATVYVTAVPLEDADLYLDAGVHRCDPSTARAHPGVVLLEMRDLFEGSVLPEDPRLRVTLAAEVLRVVAAGVLAGRGLRAAETVDWSTIAEQLTAVS